MDQFKAMHVFRAVAQCKSFAQAAELLDCLYSGGAAATGLPDLGRVEAGDAVPVDRVQVEKKETEVSGLLALVAAVLALLSAGLFRSRLNLEVAPAQSTRQ